MIHKLLARLLKRAGLSEDKVPTSTQDWQNFLKMINDVYLSYDNDRYLLERSLEISSHELEERLQKDKDQIAQLAKSARLLSLGTLASGVAHELNNPLTGIMGYAHLILREETLSERNRSRLVSIEKLSRRMAEIVGNLKRFSHSEIQPYLLQ